MGPRYFIIFKLHKTFWLINLLIIYSCLAINIDESRKALKTRELLDNTEQSGKIRDKNDQGSSVSMNLMELGELYLPKPEESDNPILQSFGFLKSVKRSIKSPILLFKLIDAELELSEEDENRETDEFEKNVFSLPSNDNPRIKVMGNDLKFDDIGILKSPEIKKINDIRSSSSGFNENNIKKTLNADSKKCEGRCSSYSELNSSDLNKESDAATPEKSILSADNTLAMKVQNDDLQKEMNVLKSNVIRKIFGARPTNFRGDDIKQSTTANTILNNKKSDFERLVDAEANLPEISVERRISISETPSDHLITIQRNINELSKDIGGNFLKSDKISKKTNDMYYSNKQERNGFSSSGNQNRLYNSKESSNLGARNSREIMNKREENVSPNSENDISLNDDLIQENEEIESDELLSLGNLLPPVGLTLGIQSGRTLIDNNEIQERSSDKQLERNGGLLSVGNPLPSLGLSTGLQTT